MISHTKVNRDARVARSAQALSEAGYETHLVCLRNPVERNLPDGLEQLQLHELADYQGAASRFLRRAIPSSLTRVPRLLLRLLLVPVYLLLAFLGAGAAVTGWDALANCLSRGSIEQPPRVSAAQASRAESERMRIMVKSPVKVSSRLSLPNVT